MREPVTVYETRVHGFWTPRHEIYQAGKLVGTLDLRRGRLGTIVEAEYRPEKGSPLRLRREPGLLRSQFSLWAQETQEWLGSSIRFHFFRREIELSTGGKPFKLVPLPGFRRGWALRAPKTGEAAQIQVGIFGRDARIEVYRRLDFLLVLIAYGVGAQIYGESFLPGPADHSPASAPASPGAEASS